MRFTERNPEAKARSNPDRLVIKSETAAGDRQGQLRAPAREAEKALKRVWFIWSGCRSSGSATVLSSSGLSHADCFSGGGPSRLCVVLAVLHLILSSSRISSFVEAAFPSMMAWSESVLAADARNAGVPARSPNGCQVRLF